MYSTAQWQLDKPQSLSLSIDVPTCYLKYHKNIAYVAILAHCLDKYVFATRVCMCVRGTPRITETSNDTGSLHTLWFFIQVFVLH